MSANSLVTVFCDAPGCSWWSEEHGVADTAAEARRSLKRRGWTVSVKDPEGGRRTLDFCPDHSLSDLLDRHAPGGGETGEGGSR